MGLVDNVLNVFFQRGLPGRGDTAQQQGVSDAMTAAWQAYRGQFPAALKSVRGRTDYNCRVNFCRPVVDTGVHYLGLGGVEMEAAPGLGTACEAYLERLWEQNSQDAVLTDIGINGGVCGSAFVKIEPQVGRVPRLIALDPTTVTVDTKPDDVTVITSYAVSWSEGQLEKRQLIARDDGGRSWTVSNQERPAGTNRWMTVNTLPWLYSFAPIISTKNLPSPGQAWGLPDLSADIVHLNVVINGLLSNLNKLAWLQGHKKPWVRGFSGRLSETDMSPDSVLALTGENAMLSSLDMSSDPTGSLLLYSRLREALHELAQIPEIAAGKLEAVGQLSGVALEILFGPLVMKTMTKRPLYARLLQETCRRALVLAGLAPDDGLEAAVVVVQWPHMLPVCPQDVLAWQQAGVSRGTSLQQAGYDPEQEADKRSEESGAEANAGATLLGAFDRGQGSPAMLPGAGAPVKASLGAGGAGPGAD